MYIVFKRLIDTIASIILLIFLLPLFIIIGTLIKIDSKGPIIFTQRRIGKSGKEFKIYKFRSMANDTPDVATDKMIEPNKYITNIGHIIRKTSIDELPQLFNVLKGEMSIVGPRPALFNQDELIKIRKTQGIELLIPGITGYAQIMGRDDISDIQKVNYDKIYLQKASILFDAKIIIITIIKVIKMKNVKN